MGIEVKIAAALLSSTLEGNGGGEKMGKKISVRETLRRHKLLRERQRRRTAAKTLSITTTMGKGEYDRKCSVCKRNTKSKEEALGWGRAKESLQRLRRDSVVSRAGCCRALF